MHASSYIARRLRLSAGAASGSRTGVAIAVIGVALAVIILEMTLGIVFGFKEQIRSKLMGFDGQISVLPPLDATSGEVASTIEFTPELQRTLAEHLPGASASLTRRAPAMVKTDDDFSVLFMLARDSAHDFSFERNNIVAGVWPDFETDSCKNHIVLSAATASALNLEAGSRPMLYFFDGQGVKARRATVAGIYRADFGEYDRNVAYASPRMLADVAGFGHDEGTAIELSGLPDDPLLIAVMSQNLQQQLVDDYLAQRISKVYRVTDITQTGAVYFSWLDLLNTNVIVIFVLMLFVAGFTLISSLFIIILEQVSTVGILRTLGATRRDIVHIFTLMGMRPVAMGMIIGNAIGLGLLLVQLYTGVVTLNPEMYYLRHVPVSLHFMPIIWLNIGVAAASWLILNIPAHAASRIDPAASIRYE